MLRMLIPLFRILMNPRFKVSSQDYSHCIFGDTGFRGEQSQNLNQLHDSMNGTNYLSVISIVS